MSFPGVAGDVGDPHAHARRMDDPGIGVNLREERGENGNDEFNMLWGANGAPSSFVVVASAK